MDVAYLPVLLFLMIASSLAIAMVVVGKLIGPRRSGQVKRMPYESGMDPIHDARRRFDVHFHLVAIAFLVFDVELLFLYPWAVANRDPEGLSRLAEQGVSRTLIFGEVMFFVALLAVGLVYVWRRGVFRWR